MYSLSYQQKVKVVSPRRCDALEMDNGSRDAAVRAVGSNLVGGGIATSEKHENSSAGSGNIVSIAPSSAFPPRHFEPTRPFGHGISNPTPCQARRPPQLFSLALEI
jgi:hypothetical protein